MPDLIPITARPCPTCPWRIDHTATAAQRAAVAAAADPDADMFRCDDPAAAMFGKVCAAWLAMAWGDSNTAVAAVQARRIMLADLLPDPGWPALHATAAAVLRAGVPAQRQVGTWTADTGQPQATLSGPDSTVTRGT